jgi:Bacterial Ig-like domain (group 3)/FG-GAP-like repeat
MIPKSVAPFVVLVSLVSITLPFAAQRRSNARADRPIPTGPLSILLLGPAPSPQHGPIAPAGWERRASQGRLNKWQFPPPSGSPTFLTAPTYESGGLNAYSVAVADLNGDGKPDLVVANQYSTTGTNGDVSVLLGNGDGTFQPAVNYASGAQYAVSVVVGDVSGDGKLDLVVANDCSDVNCTGGAVSVLLGNGDGTFQAAVSYASGALNAVSVTLADVNGDGKLDLLVANQCPAGSGCTTSRAGSVGVLLGNGDGTFQAAVTYSSGGDAANSVAVADVNGDGKPDLLVANLCADSSCAKGSMSVLLGNGNGTFQAAVSYGSGGLYTSSVAVGDVNGDGKLDLLVANGCFIGGTNCTNGAPGAVSVLLGNGDGTFQTVVTYASGGSNAYSVAVADVNGDGKPDVLVANEGDTSVGVLLGNGDGTFRTAVNYASGGRAYSVAVTDVNGDGKPDLLVANQCASCSSSGLISVLLGNGDGTFQAAPMYPSSFSPHAVAVGDVNGDGKPDLVVSSRCADLKCDNGGSVSVLLGNGDGTFLAKATYGSNGLNASSVALGDVNGDGKLDVVVANYCVDVNCAFGSVGVLLGNGDGTFQAPVTYASGGFGPGSVALADVNRDGKLDAVVANYCTDSNCRTNGVVSVLLGNGDGTFKSPVTYGSGGPLAVSLALADVNGDGKTDVVVTNLCASVGSCGGIANGTVSVLLGNGDGTFETVVSYGIAGYPYSEAVGDVNGDGKPDLVVMNEAGSVDVLLGNGNGTFQTALITPTPNANLEAQSLALADFNGDGELDVASGGGNFFLLGNGDGTFQTPITLGASGPGVAVGDFSHDGRPDLAVAGNFGVTILRNIAANFHHATTTVVTSSLNPAPAGQSVTFTATVTPAFNVGALTGSVTFYDGANALGTLAIANGQAMFSTSSLAVAVHSITASYSGDSNYLVSTSPPLLEMILAPTTTALTSSLNPSTFGQSVTFTATVSTTAGGAPTGTVTFTDGSNVLGVVSLSGGKAILSTSTLGAGNHSIVASYNGDSTHQASASTPLIQTVQMASTTLGLTSNINPSGFGESVTFTASVTPQVGGSATGTVTYFDGAKSLGTAAVTPGNLAKFTITTLAIGTHSITASYSGDSNLTGSTSGVVSQVVAKVVKKASTTTALTSSLNPAFVGQTITLTATVTDQYQGVVTGTVKFKAGAATLGTVTLVNGQASINVSFSKSGTVSITATYSGDKYNAGSTSPPLKEVVNKYPSSTAVVSSLNPSMVGQLVTFTATVTTNGNPTGTVTFKSGATKLGTVTLTSNTASLSTSSLTAGTHVITAIYSGDSTFAGSTSQGLNQVVN